MAAT
ncbi:hypothetical protein YPPY03_3318, partial [Yersinia pestis PY-03]|jgi:hypothetical protein